MSSHSIPTAVNSGSNDGNDGNSKSKSKSKSNTSSPAFKPDSRPRSASNQFLANKSQVIEKYRGWDGEYMLSAGGIIPYDDSGFWCILEHDGKLTDIGGKYRFEDIDIDGCVAREWNEETYCIAELRRKDIKTLAKSPNTKVAYVWDNYNVNRTYKSYMIKIDEILHVTGESEFTSEMFTNARNNAISLNERVPEQMYKSMELRYIPYSDVESNNHLFSFRLKHLSTHLLELCLKN